MLSTSLVLMSGVNSVMASTGADFGTKYTSTHHLGWSRQISCGLNCATKRVASNTVPASEFSRLSVTHLASPDMHLSPEFQNQSLTVIPVLDNSFLTDRTMSKLLPPLSTREERGGFGNINTQPTLTLPCSPREGTKNASAGTMRTPVRIYAEVMKLLADGVKPEDDSSFLSVGTMPSNAFMPLSIHSQLAPAGAPRHRASGHNQPTANFPLTASVCFITDTGACSGNSFGGGANTEDGGHGAPGESGDNSGNEPDYTLDNYERCAKEGYTQTACSSVQQPSNRCPYNSDIFEKCVCKPNLQTCTVPYYGVGEACGGKYASCERDDARACNENGTGSNASCPAEQTPNKVCPYNASYHDKCVCRSDLKTCTKPEYGVGTACGGKYLSCQRDDAKACNEDGYTQSATCSSTQQKDGLCPYNNAYYKQCVCKSEYKYACTGTGYTGGSGSSCDGKYSKCSCSASYNWTGSVCTYVNPCAGYYECGGTWQYCEGSKCSSDSTKCSTYCVSDYFPNSCDSSSNCNGIYRNGYCSGSCSSSSSGGSGSCSQYGLYDGPICSACSLVAVSSSSSNSRGCYDCSMCSSISGSGSGSGDSGGNDSGTSHTHNYSCPDGYSTSNSWGNSAQTTSKVCSCGATSGTCYKAPSETYRNCCDDIGSYCNQSSSEHEACNNYSGNSKCSSVVSQFLNDGCTFVWCGGTLQSSSSNSARFRCP